MALRPSKIISVIYEVRRYAAYPQSRKLSGSGPESYHLPKDAEALRHSGTQASRQ
ncbi:unnamed protein product [Penicillium camemberti]|uniref:Str. FM013 n=1 Tax=Penicillium camemberti (strain FM 013) TaxID=1429867 RepID=A0A0G4PRA3_PENC3|nr:unnamed protein product [Penicillium camemberti]